MRRRRSMSKKTKPRAAAAERRKRSRKIEQAAAPVHGSHRQCWTAIFMNGRVTPGVLFCCRSFVYVFGCAFKCSALQPPGGNQVDGLPPVRNTGAISGCVKTTKISFRFEN